ncbi:hypothetical protein L810_5924 [Burkholderia sp. AU4i]|nr:hypothetical protein L810_5924 [Burkholderia sp. AU4i]
MLRRAGGRFDPIAARSRRDAAPAPALCCHAGDAGCARVGMQRPMASFASAAIIPGERNGVFKKSAPAGKARVWRFGGGAGAGSIHAAALVEGG